MIAVYIYVCYFRQYYNNRILQDNWNMSPFSSLLTLEKWILSDPQQQKECLAHQLIPANNYKVF